MFTCEDFERTSGRFEKIYGIDLLFDGSESVSGLLLDDGCAIKVIIYIFNLLINKQSTLLRLNKQKEKKNFQSSKIKTKKSSN